MEHKFIFSSSLINNDSYKSEIRNTEQSCELMKETKKVNAHKHKQNSCSECFEKLKKIMKNYLSLYHNHFIYITKQNLYQLLFIVVFNER